MRCACECGSEAAKKEREGGQRGKGEQRGEREGGIREYEGVEGREEEG